MARNTGILLTIGGLILYFATRATASGGGGGTTNALMLLSYLGQSNQPRGIRNNNPGNLRISGNAWQGKIPTSQNTDGAFEQFSYYVYGVRAMIKLIGNDHTNYGLNTVAQIINR